MIDADSCLTEAAPPTAEERLAELQERMRSAVAVLEWGKDNARRTSEYAAHHGDDKAAAFWKGRWDGISGAWQTVSEILRCSEYP